MSKKLALLMVVSAGLLACGDSVSDEYRYFVGTWTYASGTGVGNPGALVLKADYTFTWGKASGRWEIAESRPNPFGPPMKEIRVDMAGRRVRLAEDPRGLFVGESGSGAIWKKKE